MSYLRELISWLWDYAVDWAWDHPMAMILAGFAVARMFGTVVEEGWRGVLFSFGAAKKELEPGFHWLAPIVHTVRKVRMRSISIDLPPQRVVTRDGLAYEVDANVVYHVQDPTAAVVQIDNYDRGCRVVIPMVIALLLQEQTSQQLADRSRLDEEFATRLQARLHRWGLAVEHAGLKSIAPTRETLRVTQMRVRCAERARLWDVLRNGGESEESSLALLGAPTRLIERSVVRRRGYRRRFAVSRRFATIAKPQEPPFKVGDRVWANWWELGEFLPGKVTKIDGENLHIKYDDGDTEIVHVRNVRRSKPK